MKVLLCAEGPGDMGRDGQGPDQGATDGWMQPLLRRLLCDPTIEFCRRRRRELTLLPREGSRHRPLPAGHGAKALLARLQADQDRCDLLVFMVDADSIAPAEFRRIRQEIVDGFTRRGMTTAIACVPVGTSESWLLSDLAAWRALGLRSEDLLPRRPERAWGKPRDSRGRHPHVDFAKACKDARQPDSPSTRANLAERTDLLRLRQACPMSYGAFADDLAAAVV